MWFSLRTSSTSLKMAEPSCSIHPDEKNFYLYEGKKPRCKSCVRDGLKRSRLKRKQAAASAGVSAAPASADAPAPVARAPRAEKPKPAPARPHPAAPRARGSVQYQTKDRNAPNYWSVTWGRPPGGWQGPPSTSPDAWGPFKGMTDDEIRYRKTLRGQPYLARGSAWVSKDEWDAHDKWLEEYKVNLANKHNR